MVASMRQWRLIRSGPASGARNMALDESLLLNVTDSPVLRFYGWSPHCLSLGYGQRSRIVDRERLQGRGCTLVRRPGGGGAILHAQELTWCLVLPAAHPLAAGSLLSGYRRIAGVLCAALQSMGITAEINQEKIRRRDSMVCFETPAPFEIAAGGRKLLGSARVQRRHAILQHGSLPLTGDVAAICELLAYPDERARNQAMQRLRRRATTLTEVSGGNAIDAAGVAAAIVAAFSDMHDVCLVESCLTDAELAQARALEECRYGNMDWVCRR